MIRAIGFLVIGLMLVAPRFGVHADELLGPKLGKKTFEMFCAVCHGTSGEGSTLGVQLNGLASKLKTDDEIIRTITKGGGPGSAMSAYESGLSRDEIFWTMIYIRELQGEKRVRGDGHVVERPEAPPVSEEAKRGESVFNGKGRCIDCHSYRTRGGLLASDLSTIATEMTSEEIRTAVLRPNAEINPDYATKDMQLSDGTRLSGRVRAETADSIQIANEDATLWRTIFKKDIQRMRDGRRSTMPDDYATELTADEQRYLFAFLDTLR